MKNTKLVVVAISAGIVLAVIPVISAQAYTAITFYSSTFVPNSSATSVAGTHRGGGGSITAGGFGDVFIQGLQGSGLVGGSAQTSANGSYMTLDFHANYTNSRVQCKWLYPGQPPSGTPVNGYCIRWKV